MVCVVGGRAGGRVGRAVGAGGHVGADLRELRCDELQRESVQSFSSSSLDKHRYTHTDICRAHSFIFEVELSNQPAVISGVHDLSSDEQLHFGVCAVGFDASEDAAADRADGVVGVGPDVQVVHLPALIGKPHHQSDVLPPERPGDQTDNTRRPFTPSFGFLLHVFKSA